MKKAALVGSLSRYAERDTGSTKGQKTLARFLAHYFDSLEIPADQNRGHWSIDQYIPQLLLGAFEVFRTSEDETVRQLRARYEDELSRPFMDLTDIWGDGVEKALAVQSLGYLFNDVFNADWFPSRINDVFNAEQNLLQQVLYKFLDRVFSQGLFNIIDTSPQRGVSGTFGETTLRGYVIDGRLMLTFARPGEPMEHSASFVCGDDDPLVLGGRVQHVDTDLQTAIAMINDVMTGWPEDSSAQADILKYDDNVMTG